MGRVIDYDRGVTIRKDEKTGVEVFMYKDTPGVFLSIQGTEVSAELARMAGYSVDKLLKQREMRRLLSVAEAEIRARLETAEESAKIVLEKGGFTVLDIGLGRHRVLGPDGDPITNEVLPLEQATLLLDQLVPEVVS